MNEEIYDIEDMPSLSKRLGKKKVNRIRYAGQNPSQSTRGRKIDNTVLDYMQGRTTSDFFCPASDIISGVARLDHYAGKEDRNIPLSKNSIYTILQCMDIITTQEVMKLLNVGQRQAQVYVRACKLCITFIEKEMVNNEEVNDPLIELGISDIDQYDTI